MSTDVHELIKKQQKVMKDLQKINTQLRSVLGVAFSPSEPKAEVKPQPITRKVFVGVFEQPGKTVPVILKSRSLEDAEGLLKVIESASEYTLTKVEPVEDFLGGSIYYLAEYSANARF